MLRRRIVGIALLVVLSYALTASAALAQGGTGDKVVVGQNYVLSAGDELGGDLTVLGGNARLEDESLVHGDVVVLGGTLTVSGDVRGDMTILGGDAKLTRTAVIEGSLSTFGGTVRRDEGSVVRGDVLEGVLPLPRGQIPLPYGLEAPGAQRFQDGPETRSLQRSPVDAMWDFLRWQIQTVGWALLMALLGIVALLVAPKPLARVTSGVGSQPALSFAVGLLTIVVGGLLGTLLLIACGLGLIVWLVVWLAALFGWIAVGFWVGRRLFQAFRLNQGSSLWEVALGVFIVTALTRVPLCLGFLVGLVAGSIGLGAVVLTRFGTQPADGVNRLPARSSTATAREPDSESTSTANGPSSHANDSDVEIGGDPLSSLSSELPMADIGEESRLPGQRYDLETIVGIEPEDAQRLRSAGIMSMERLLTFEPETLGPMIGVDSERIRRDDWIGQAARLVAGE